MTEEQQQADINAIQRLHFELFRRVRYNLLDGERVVGDLLEWHDLWYSVLPTRFPYAFNKPDDRHITPTRNSACYATLAGKAGLLTRSTSGPIVKPFHNCDSALKSAGAQRDRGDFARCR